MMVKKSISVTEPQNDWIRSQIATRHYGNDSELIRELIRERQLREQETRADVDALRAKILKAEQSGFSTKTPTEILSEIKDEIRST